MPSFKGEPTIDISKIMPPKEKASFQNLELEALFGLNAIDSIPAWNNITSEKLLELIIRESSVSGRPIEIVREDLKKRIALVVKGLSAIKRDNLDAVEVASAHLHVLQLSLE